MQEHVCSNCDGEENVEFRTEYNEYLCEPCYDRWLENSSIWNSEFDHTE